MLAASGREVLDNPTGAGSTRSGYPKQISHDQEERAERSITAPWEGLPSMLVES